MFTSKLNRAYLIISMLALSLVLIIRIASPSFINSYSDNWSNSFKEKKLEIERIIQARIDKEEASLAKISQKIKEEISKANPVYDEDYLELIPSNKKISINLFKSNRLIGWNAKELINSNKLTQLLFKWGVGKAFFYETPLVVYLSMVSEIDSILIFTSIPIHKNYFLKNSFYQSLSLTDALDKEFNVSLLPNFDMHSETTNYLKIKNKSGIEIGSVSVSKSSKETDVQKLKDKIALIQSILVIISILLFLLWLSSRKVFEYDILKLVHFIISAVIVRGSFALLNIGEYLGFADLINPIYFSSPFLLGLTKSPLELFLTVVTILAISYKMFIYFTERANLNKLNNAMKSFLGVLFLFLLLLLYNGFTSAIKSIIFDSSILYFKDASLFSGYQTVFMYLNVLLIGLSTILFSTTFVLGFVNVITQFIKKNIKGVFFLLFFVATVFFLLDEMFYSKSSFLLSLVFSVLVFGLSYYWISIKSGHFQKIIVLLFSSSILSISFLNYFNTELETNSLKTIANELTRSNINLYQYYLVNALEEIKENIFFTKKIKSKKINFDAEAFLLWTNTTLSKEFGGSIVNIIDRDKNLLGKFEYNYHTKFSWTWIDKINKTTLDNLVKTDELNKTIKGITPIFNRDSLVCYVEVVVLGDTYKLPTENKEKLISHINPIKKISINADLLKVYDFRNNKLSNYFTNVFLTNKEKETIKSVPLTQNNDRWANVIINGERNIFYLKKIKNKEGDRLLAVGLSSKDITWNLFDFFKVFFVHSIMILFAMLVYLLVNYKKWRTIKISFKTKILVSLLLVSILPLIFLATYFKNISDNKNKSAINYKLGKHADKVEEYINTYFSTSTLSNHDIYDKATRDLEINFSIYEGKNLIYSSEGNYYKIEFLPLLLNPNAYLALNRYGMQEIVVEESIEKYSFNSLYHKCSVSDFNYIINVNDLFNNYQLPMTGIELNVFLFGTYSLAIIMIVLLSTLLANQISSPIEKLTKATRSVANGDMDIQLQSVESGEIKELVNGFNLMVRQLKKNQIELAEVERESAWREMAKQVAHEIKNPLTPMKLAIQHLVAAHNDKSMKYDSIFKKVTTTIINQIDTLKNIASEFSNFAKMPSIKLEEINIIDVANKTADLFIEEKCSVKVISDKEVVVIKSDNEQFQRMIINLIRNSIQASANEIEIDIKDNVDKVVLLVSDNGSGIDEEVLPNIFEENFTTKKTGSGLGLALTRRFLNYTNGKIAIKETSVNGTVIKIEIEKNV